MNSNGFVITRVKWTPEMAIKLTDDQRRQALGEAADAVLAEANKISPFREGILSGSGVVDADSTSATISYDTPYAARLHENPQYNFNFGRKGKWLEATFVKMSSRVTQIFADAMKRAIGP